jgi:hypothetical protein
VDKICSTLNGPSSHPLDDPDSTASGFFGDDSDGTRPIGRKTLLKDDLLERLTRMIRSCEGCDTVRVIDVIQLDPPDKAGCNWSMALILEPNGTEAPVYALGYAFVIAHARESWNVAW